MNPYFQTRATLSYICAHHKSVGWKKSSDPTIFFLKFKSTRPMSPMRGSPARSAAWLEQHI